MITINNGLPLIRWMLKLMIAGAVFMASPGAQAQTSPFPIGFPIHDSSNAEINPYSARIVSVVDHYANPFGKHDINGPTVMAYTGEVGALLSSCKNTPCGSNNLIFKSQSALHFFVNGNYAGGDAFNPGPDAVLRSDQSLDYRGHSGIDYGYGPPTQVFAAHDGELFTPAQDPLLDCLTCLPQPVTPKTFNTFYIVDATGRWSTWYLHTIAGSITATTSTCTLNGQKINRGKKLANGDTCIGHVNRKDPVAQVGDTGVPGSPHLHFEVRASCSFVTSVTTGCKVVDPYGWEWITSDLLGLGKASQGMHQAAPLWDLSTWGLTMPQVAIASVSAVGNTWTINVNGSQFDPANPVITLWNGENFFGFACGSPTPAVTASVCGVTQFPATVTILSKSTTQITAQIQIDPTLNVTPDVTVVKVANGSNGPGPRSPGTRLSVVTSPSYSLLLYKTPAPGGGVFLGFGGFQSATDDGRLIFNSGVDLNGDNIPDFSADFESGPNGRSLVAFPGFTQIFGTRMNRRGDKAFSGINQASGRTTPGIYLLQTGLTSPVKVAQPGDTCPAPCPVVGPSFMNVAGPFAIGETGEVVFSAQLNGPTPTPNWALYLFSPPAPPATTGTYTKIAVDGVGGDITPVGGTFTSQNFFGSVGIVPPTPGSTSGPDVIFSDLVTGGGSAAGIFRFSGSTKKLSKLVAQGDPAPSGVTGTLGMPLGSGGGQNLVFYASVTGGNTNQVIGLIPDITAPTPPKLVAFEGEPTGTIAGGRFATPPNNPPLPFAFFGQGQGAPAVRKDGAVVFSAVLVGAVSLNGLPTTQGLFFWDGQKISKIVVDGDQLTNGKSVAGVLQFAISNTGNVYYFATTEN